MKTDYYDNPNKKHFDLWSQSYDQEKMSNWFQYTQKLAISHLSLQKDAKVLDVGCGTGFAVLYLGSLLTDGQAHGIDLSKGMIQKAKEKIPSALSNRVQFHQASSDHIPYQDGLFDAIICTNSFHHYPDPIKSLKEMKRVLRPKGHLVILDSARNLSVYAWLWDRFLRFFEKGHICYYTTQELENFLKQSGYSNIELRYCRNDWKLKGKLFSSIQLWRAEKLLRELQNSGSTDF